MGINLYPYLTGEPSSRENPQVSRQFKQKFRPDRWVHVPHVSNSIKD